MFLATIKGRSGPMVTSMKLCATMDEARVWCDSLATHRASWASAEERKEGFWWIAETDPSGVFVHIHGSKY